MGWIYTNTIILAVRGVVDVVVPAAIRLFKPYRPRGEGERSDDAIARELAYFFSYYFII